MIIKLATLADLDSIWEIFRQIIATGDTYLFNPNMQKIDFQQYWFGSPIQTFVAEENGVIVGSYIIKPNQPDLGSHIANGSYIVSLDYQGRGIGKRLCEHSLQMAKSLGYMAMQFNMVVSTNEAAVHLWQKCGFQIIGTIPKGFRHQTLGFVDAFIMFRAIEQ